MSSNSLYLLLLLPILAFSQHPRERDDHLTIKSDPDFSYMEVVYNATDLSFDEEYDYIVVGGGSTGCPLAATLSEKYSVLLLERGDVPLAYPGVLRASNRTVFVPYGQSFSSEEGIFLLISDSILGGTSMRSSGYTRASEEFFASSSDVVEWDMGLVEEAQEWVEKELVSPTGPINEWQSTMRDAFLEARILPDNGFSLNRELGTSFQATLFDQNGWRHGADQLLNKGDFRNLRVAVNATVERVSFSKKSPEDNSSPRATGVIYTDLNGNSHRAYVRGSGEIILSKSAFGSPKLLLISGIGPEPYLTSLRIPIVYPQPNVGKFMRDSPRISALVVPTFPVNNSVRQVSAISKDYEIRGLSQTIPIAPTPLPFSYFPFETLRSARLTVASITATLPRPLSSGTLRLGSRTNISSTPIVSFEYFSVPEDLSLCTAAARKISEILNTTSMQRFTYQDPEGGRDFTYFGVIFPDSSSGNASFEDYCRNTFSTSYTYIGGCVLGKVVDGDFRVIGTESLRVVDSSTFIVLPETSAEATKMMLGRYVGQKMLRERKE